jgi:predicted membrane protein
MRKQTATYVAIAVILVGVLLLVANLTETPIWPYLWPTALIATGVWLVMRPRVVRHSRPRTWRLLGDVHRTGRWHVSDEDIWNLIGDVVLDLRDADIPPGKTEISVHGFVGQVDVRVPPDAGVRVSGQAMVLDANAFDYDQTFIMTPYDGQTLNYEDAERRVHIDLQLFVADLNVK